MENADRVVTILDQVLDEIAIMDNCVWLYVWYHREESNKKGMKEKEKEHREHFYSGTEYRKQ